MVFESFRANVLARVLLFVALCFASLWGWLNTDWVVTPVACGVLVLLSVAELLRYVERSTGELASFLSFVAHHDYSTPIPLRHKGRVFAQLQDAYALLSGELRRLNRQKAAHQLYLEAVIEHVGIALICLDDAGNVRMMNEPARQLLGLAHLNSIRTLSRVDARLPELLERLGDGERALFSAKRGEELLQLVLYATRFELLEQRYKLVSFQNIRHELDRQEIDSWQKLIRVLTHEIMNSVTPLISLSRLLRETMIDESGNRPVFRALTAQEQHDILRSLTAIQMRSSGLLEFVNAYRSLAKVPAPCFSDVSVRALLERVRILVAQELERRHICLALRCSDAALSIRADASHVEQVLLNLIRNAVEAFNENDGRKPEAASQEPRTLPPVSPSVRATPRIELQASRDEHGGILIQVIDNGPGIAAEHIENVFVPFFTTKRNGTGVGLSISRQLVQANNGSISVRSARDEGCVFTLKFH